MFVLRKLSFFPLLCQLLTGCHSPFTISTSFPAFQETLASSLDFYRWAAAALLKAPMGPENEGPMVSKRCL